jgi:hypothetical protein
LGRLVSNFGHPPTGGWPFLFANWLPARTFARQVALAGAGRFAPDRSSPQRSQGRPPPGAALLGAEEG